MIGLIPSGVYKPFDISVMLKIRRFFYLSYLIKLYYIKYIVVIVLIEV